MSGELEIDEERFIYEKVETLGGDSWYIKVGCHHRHTDSVRNLLTNSEVARLCLDCNAQLPVEGPIEW